MTLFDKIAAVIRDHTALYGPEATFAELFYVPFLTMIVFGVGACLLAMVPA